MPHDEPIGNVIQGRIVVHWWKTIESCRVAGNSRIACQLVGTGTLSEKIIIILLSCGNVMISSKPLYQQTEGVKCRVAVVSKPRTCKNGVMGAAQSTELFIALRFINWWIRRPWHARFVSWGDGSRMRRIHASCALRNGQGQARCLTSPRAQINFQKWRNPYQPTRGNPEFDNSDGQQMVNSTYTKFIHLTAERN
jgi:hypothetical protein